MFLIYDMLKVGSNQRELIFMWSSYPQRAETTKLLTLKYTFWNFYKERKAFSNFQLQGFFKYCGIFRKPQLSLQLRSRIALNYLEKRIYLKLIFSKKATKNDRISTVTYLVNLKLAVRISSFFVAFLEKMHFIEKN